MKIKNSGVTLISMVITVIVLLIIAGITINLTLGENGIINRGEMSVSEHNKQEATEKINLKITTTQMYKYSKEQRMPTLQELADNLIEDEEIEYVELESKKFSALTKIDVGENNSIFTKLKQYPYEFEINSSLQLASINGIKIADSTPSKDSTQPTGIKTNAYIRSERTQTMVYNAVTNMNGFEWTTDENNTILEYVSYSNENGFTVKKSGWYFVTISAIVASSSATQVSCKMVIDGNELGYIYSWSGSTTDYNSDRFPIYLKERYYFLFSD